MIEEPPILIHDVYEPEVCKVIDKFVQPGDCAIDVGACVGFFAVYMSKIVGENGLVIAFEPQLESYRHLLRNVLVEHKCNNVACVKTALWKCDMPELKLFSITEVGYSSMHHFDPHYVGSQLYTYQPETVEGRSLDTWMEGNNHPRFIKIDVEGCELEVLMGAQHLLRRGVDCVVLEFNYYIFEQTRRQDRDIRSFMAELGYECFLISIDDGTPIKVPLDRKIVLNGPLNQGGARYINVMFSTEDKVRERWPDYDRRQDAYGIAEYHHQRDADRGLQLQSAAQR